MLCFAGKRVWKGREKARVFSHDEGDIFLTGDLPKKQERLEGAQKTNFCAICALEMRFFALDSSSLVMDFRTKQHSKRSCRTPSVRCEVSALG